MQGETKYQQKIAAFKDWESLRDFWQKIQERQTPEWASGKALEYLILRAFELDGAKVRYPFEVRIDEEIVEQIDGVVYCDSLSCLIECKDYSADKVNFEPIAKIRNQLLRRPSSTIASIFSLNGFTEPATILANYVAPQTVLLWESYELDYVLQKENICVSLLNKFRKCVEEGVPNFNILTLNLQNGNKISRHRR